MSAVIALALLIAPESVSEVLARGGKVRLSPRHGELARYDECLASQLRLHAEQSPGAGHTALEAGAIAACQEAREAAAARIGASLKGKRFRDPPKRQAEVERTLKNVETGRLFLFQVARPAPAVGPAAPAPRSQPVPQGQSALSVAQVEIVYDQCLARAAANASRTDAPAEAIFGIAQSACADTRAMLLVRSGGAAAQPFDAIDAERAASFPAQTSQLREMMREANFPPDGPK